MNIEKENEKRRLKLKEQKRIKEIIEASQNVGPYVRPDHEKLVTRRDFISSGFMAGFGSALTFSAPSLLLPNTSFAQFADSCLMTEMCSNVPFLSVDAAGGMSLAGSNVMVGFGAGEDQLDHGTGASDGYIRLGIAPSDHPKNTGMVNSDYGLKFHSKSWLMKGLNSVLEAGVDANGDPDPNRPDLRGSIDGLLLCTITSDDTGGNPLNSSYIVNSLGAQGDLVQILGSRNSDSGANSVAPSFSVDLTKRPSPIQGFADGESLISIGDKMMESNFLDASGAGGDNRLKEFMKRITNMSVASLDKYSNLNDNSLVKQNIETALNGSVNMFDQFSPSNLNPLKNAEDAAVIQSVFGVDDINSLSNDDRQIGAISNLLTRGVAGAGNLVVSGCDYHNGTGATGNLKDFQIGRSIGLAIRMAHQRGKNLFVHLYSDGAAGGDPGGAIDTTLNGDGRVNWTADSGTRSSAMILVYKHGHTRADNGETSDMLLGDAKRQIGHFAQGGGNVSTATSISNNPSDVWKVIALNYIATLVNSTDDEQVKHIAKETFKHKFGISTLPPDANNLIRLRSLVA